MRPRKHGDMVGKKEMRLLQMHGGRNSRALDSRPVRHSLCGRRGWKYHASCSVNLLKRAGHTGSIRRQKNHRPKKVDSSIQ